MQNMEDLPDDIFILENAPHSWLFPHMAVAVHHGKAGMTAAGLRAGVPGVIIPFCNDNFAGGRRIHEAGTGARLIPCTRLVAENLADAVQFALLKVVKNTAKELGNKTQAEDGAEFAAGVVMGGLTISSAP